MELNHLIVREMSLRPLYQELVKDMDAATLDRLNAAMRKVAADLETAYYNGEDAHSVPPLPPLTEAALDLALTRYEALRRTNPANPFVGMFTAEGETQCLYYTLSESVDPQVIFMTEKTALAPPYLVIHPETLPGLRAAVPEVIFLDLAASVPSEETPNEPAPPA